MPGKEALGLDEEILKGEEEDSKADFLYQYFLFCVKSVLLCRGELLWRVKL